MNTSIIGPLVGTSVARLATINANVLSGSSDARQSSIGAQLIAAASHDEVMEAEAVLSLARSCTPMVEPRSALSSLRYAEQVFRRHSLAIKVTCCHVGQARAHLDLAEIDNALKAAQSALQVQALPAEFKLGALLVVSSCHLHVGDVDEAIDTLNGEAVQLIEESGYALRPHIKHAIAMAHLKAWIETRHPGLWVGCKRPRFTGPCPSEEMVFAILDDSGPVSSPGRNWGYIQAAGSLLLGLTVSGSPSLEKLDELAAGHLALDPPLSLEAFFFQSLIFKRMGLLKDSIASLHSASQIAQDWNLKLSRNDIRIQRSSMAC